MNNLLSTEEALFLLVDYIKDFHESLIHAYNLDDIPYNLSGKVFPKKGVIAIKEAKINYHFHGNGCTLVWNNIEIEYAIDPISKHEIKIGAYSISQFLATLPGEGDGRFSFEEISTTLQQLESRGILMKRKPEDLESWHVNDEWYQSRKEGRAFRGGNTNEIDW